MIPAALITLAVLAMPSGPVGHGTAYKPDDSKCWIQEIHVIPSGDLKMMPDAGRVDVWVSEGSETKLLKFEDMDLWWTSSSKDSDLAILAADHMMNPVGVLMIGPLDTAKGTWSLKWSFTYKDTPYNGSCSFHTDHLVYDLSAPEK